MLAAVDLGYGWTKAMAVSTWVEPSVVGPASQLFASLGGLQGVRLWDAGSEYFVGELAAKHSLAPWHSLGDDKPGEPNTRRLLLAALAATAGVARGPVQIDLLVTGLPVNLIHGQQAAMERLITALRGLPVRAQVGTVPVDITLTVDGCRVYPQPYGSYLDLVLNSAGDLVRRDIAKGRTLVVDVGFHTTDLLAIEGLTPSPRYTRGANYGLAVAYAPVGRQLNRPEWEIDQEVRRNREQVPGLERAYKDLAAGISAMVRGLNQHFDLYLVTGGGGSELYQYLDLPGERQLAVEPNLANVRGYFKAAVRLQGQGSVAR